MRFIAYGLNHTTAPVEVREKYALPPEKVGEVLKALQKAAPEAVFLSTCNRVEFYLSTDKVEDSLENVRKSLDAFHKLKNTDLKKYFYLYEGPEAFKHLFRVASSLDSMVVGEAQVLGQVKEAYEAAQRLGATGPMLNGVFHRAFSAAKKVRSQTDIAKRPVNVSSVAVALAGQIFQSLKEHSVLLLGAGDMAELTARHLSDAGVTRFFIANRTKDKAKALAAAVAGEALSLQEGLRKLLEVDIVLSSLGGGQTLLKRADVERVMKERGGRPLFLIDIAVPRSVEAEIGRIESVYLYNIDDLSAIAESNRTERRKAVEDAEAVLKQELEGLYAWLASLEVVPTVVRLREKFEKARHGELEDFLKKHPDLDEAQKRAVERLTKDLVGKLLHDPSATLKSIPSETARFEYARMLNELFQLLDQAGDE